MQQPPLRSRRSSQAPSFPHTAPSPELPSKSMSSNPPPILHRQNPNPSPKTPLPLIPPPPASHLLSNISPQTPPLISTPHPSLLNSYFSRTQSRIFRRISFRTSLSQSIVCEMIEHDRKPKPRLAICTAREHDHKKLLILRICCRDWIARGGGVGVGCSC